MKVNLELDLTPEEMRRLLGLPDVGPVNDLIVDRLRGQVEKGLDGTLLRSVVQSMVKSGTQGFESYQAFLGSLFRGGAARGERGGEPGGEREGGAAGPGEAAGGMAASRTPPEDPLQGANTGDGNR